MKNFFLLLGVFISSMCIFSPTHALDPAGKRILYVDSYHAGFGWSDGILRGIRESLQDTAVILDIVHMDTKRHTDEAFIRKSALEVVEIISELNPDVVIASDDNASRYVIEPYYKGTELPVVFCGVNWDASVYGFPTDNITGMVEVAPIPQLIDELEMYSAGERIGFIGPDTFTARKEAENYKTVFGLQLESYFAEDAQDWKAGFIRLQERVDMMIIDSHGGLYADVEEELIRFVEENTAIPTGSCYDFMADYALITFGKIPEEQGAWATQTALEILNGKPVSEIPVTNNKRGILIINTRIAEGIDADIPVEDIEIADRIVE